MRKGADPLGGLNVGGWDLLHHIYTELICDSYEIESIDLPKLTELFLKYGMDVDHPRVPYDYDNSLNPLWAFTFVPGEKALRALKMLLDRGLSVDGFSDFWYHSRFDFFMIECGDPENDAFWNEECTWSLKMILFGASYDYIYQNDEDLREFMCSSFNTGDVHMFRNWDDFEYHYDTSHCDRYPQLLGSIVHIYSKQTGEEVWTIGMGKAGQIALRESLE